MQRRTALIPATLLALSVSIAGPAQAGDLYDCGDLTTEEAQEILEQDPSDPYGLDGDNDGFACEDPDSGSGEGVAAPEADRTPAATNGDDGDDEPQVSETPSGGVDAGGGGDNSQVLVFAGLGTLIAAGGVVAARRRMSE